MNLSWHIFKKDFRSLRSFLFVWTAAVALRTTLLHWNFNETDRQILSHLRTGEVLLLALQIAIAVCLTAQAVQNDPLVGTTAFWRTRPISRPSLLGSKFLLLFSVLTGIPMLGEMVLLSLNGVTTADILASIPELLLIPLFFLIPAMLLAALTPNLGRFAVISAGLFLFLYLSVLFAWRYGILQGVRPELLVSGYLISILLAVLIGLGATIHQYFTLRTGRSSVLAATALPLITILPIYWSWDLSVPRLDSVDPKRLRAEAVEFKILPYDPMAALRSVSDPVSRGAEDRPLEVRLLMDDLPPALGAELVGFRYSLQLPGTQIRGEFPPSWWPLAIMPRTEALSNALEGSRILEQPTQPALHFSIDAKQYEAHRTGSASISARATFRVLEYRKIAELPLQTGAAYNWGSRRLEVLAVDRSSRPFQLVLKETAYSPLLKLPPRWQTLSILLWNRERKEALPGSSDRSWIRAIWGRPFYGLITGAVVPRHQLYVDRKAIQLHLPLKSDTNHFLIDQDWLEGASLALVEATEIGYFTKSAQTGGFVLEQLTK